MNQPFMRLTPRQIAFIVTMAATANVLALLAVPLGFMSIHFIQIPIILTGLILGPLAGGFVGFIGATVMAITLQKPNFYILPGNAILGAFTGLFYHRLLGRRPIISQLLSVLGAYVVQMPYVYVTDVYLMGMPQPVVTVIIATLLVEDLIGASVSHVVLHRVSTLISPEAHV